MGFRDGEGEGRNVLQLGQVIVICFEYIKPTEWQLGGFRV